MSNKNEETMDVVSKIICSDKLQSSPNKSGISSICYKTYVDGILSLSYNIDDWVRYKFK